MHLAPTQPTDQGGRGRRHAGRRLTVALAIAVVSIAGSGSQAGAYTVAPTGSPGSVTLPVVYPVQINIGLGCLSGYCGYAPTLNFLTNTNFVAYRSPATTGTQVICHSAQLQSWTTSGWAPVKSTSGTCGTIVAGQTSVTFSPYQLTAPQVANGYYRVVNYFAWGVGNKVLASQTVFPSTTTEHSCVKYFPRPCQTGAGWVSIG